MIKSILIANRGEIAVRVIRTCQELGIESVAVYSTADRDSLHVHMADKAICIGPAESGKSYLNMNNLITAAVCAGCDAVHPGVGFLSENPEFAQMVKEAGLIFIGAEPEVISMLGDKIQAKQMALKYDIPVIPGTDGAVASVAEALAEAENIGYPVIVKAASGGGGKGMRIVRSSNEMPDNYKIASAEAEASFGDKRFYVERYLEDPRHIELQIVANGEGNVLHLGERDCSVQKNHQKLLEESPSPGVSAEIRSSV